MPDSVVREPLIMEGPGDGTINGYHFESFGRIVVDPEHSVVKTEVTVDDIPELGNSLLAASGTSYFTSTGGIFARARENAVRLIDVVGVPYAADVRYIHTNDDGEEIGGMRQSLKVEKDGERHYSATPGLTGWYKGPKDLVWTPGYAIYLRQNGPGVIEGTYGQTLFSQDGTPVHAHVRRTYTYQSGNELPFDQVWRYKLLKLDVEVKDGKRKFTALVATAFNPAEPEHGDLSLIIDG